MTHTITLTIQQRLLTCRIRTSDGRSTAVRRDPWPIASLPASLSEAMDTAAMEMNFRSTENDRAPDRAAFVRAVGRGELNLELQGNEREIAAAALYLEIDWGIATVARESFSDGQACVYDTFAVNLGLRPIDQLDELSMKYRLLMADSGGLPTETVGTSDIWTRLLSERKLRVGVLGDTGVGKSTFINGVLRRPGLLPAHTDVCTSAVVSVHHAPSEADEHFVVTWLPLEVRKRILMSHAGAAAALLADGDDSVLRDELNRPFWAPYRTPPRLRDSVRPQRIGTADSAAEAQEQFEHMEALRLASTALAGWRDDSVRFASLGDLAHFVRARRPNARGGEGPNGVPRLIAAIEVHVCAPVLSHVILVDTPGMRDPDPERARAAAQTMASLHGWICLVNADAKSNLGVAAPVEDVRSRAHVKTGMVAATKMDSLTAQSRRTPIETLFKERRRFYEAYATSVEPCSALAAGFQSIAPRDERECDDEAATWTQAAWGIGLLRAFVPELPLNDLRAWERRRDAVRDRLRDSHSATWQAMADLQLEASRVLNVVQEFWRLLEQGVLHDLVMSRRKEFWGAVKGRIQELASRESALQRQIQSADRATELARLRSEREREAGVLEGELKVRREKVTTAARACESQRDTLMRDLEAWHKKRMEELPAEIKKQLEAAHKWGLKGKRDFSVSNVYTDLLVECCSLKTKDLAAFVREQFLPISWLEKESLDDELRRHTQNYVLESTLTADIPEKEDFWERWDTVVGRATPNATARAQKVHDALIGPTGKWPLRAGEFVQGVAARAEAASHPLAARLAALKKEAGEYADGMTQCLLGMEKPREALEDELTRATRRRQGLEAFLSELGATETLGD